MDSDAILTAVNAVESITNPPHTPERSSYRARKTVEQIIHLIFLLCGIVAVAFVLLISIYPVSYTHLAERRFFSAFFGREVICGMI